MADRFEQLIRAAMPTLQRDFGVSAIYVFGSMARGEARPDSDVDLLVEFAKGTRPTLFTLAGLHTRLGDLLGRPVDLGTVDSLRPALRDSVRSEMRRVA